MNEEKVRRAVEQLTMAASIIADSKKILSEEGYGFLDPIKHYVTELPEEKPSYFSYELYEKDLVDDIAKIYEEQVVVEDKCKYVVVNGVTYCEFLKEDKDGNTL